MTLIEAKHTTSDMKANRAAPASEPKEGGDAAFLLGKLQEMEELGPALGLEEPLGQLRRKMEQSAAGFHRLRPYGEINEAIDELLEEIWSWHERLRSSRAAARCFAKLKFRLAFASRLKEATDLYDKYTTDEAATSVQSRTSYPEAKSGIVGRDEDVEDIVGQLQQEEDDDDDDQQHELRVIPIVGMPGIGKTTVAQIVYSHPMVLDSFDLRIWVHVSPACLDHKEVLRRMAEAVSSSSDEHNSVEDAEKLLKEKLLSGSSRRRRYLLVLDDVWNEDQFEWDALRKQLLELSAAATGGVQIIVIVTTSRYSVAEMMVAANSSVGRPHELQGLSAVLCRQLFLQSLETNVRESLQTRYGKDLDKVIERCCGVPMAVRVLANFIAERFQAAEDLSHSISDFDWEPFTSDAGHKVGFDSMSLSYSLLPIYLRHCFRFCSLFPPDHNYDMEELGEIWRALHFAPLPSSSSSWNEAYAKLRKDCFFHKSDCSTDRKVTYYKMPHFMRQFAAYRDKQSYDLRDKGHACQMRRMDATSVQSSYHPQSCRHLSLIAHSKISAFPQLQLPLDKIKTLILLRETQMVLSNSRCKISVIPSDLLARLENLCVLDLQYTMIKKLPRAVGNLLNLRYLNLSETDITTIPESVGKLRGLMFLKLVNCRYLLKLNDLATNLFKLQKLDLSGCLSLVQMPGDLGRLTNLRTLPRFLVAEDDGRTISELQTLRGLEGDLRVENLQKVARGSDAAKAKLWNKTMLKSLTLQWKWNHGEEERDTKAIQEVLEALRPCKKLIKLEIISYMGKLLPSWMGRAVSYLDSLVEIKLFDLKKCTLPPLGILPRLRVAEISGMDSVTEVDDKFYRYDGTFPRLQKLTFSQMPKLKKWKDVIGRNMFPRLKKLTFINCPQLVALEMELPSVTELTMWLNNKGLYSSKRGLKGLTGSLKKLSISFCQELSESSECEGLQELRVLEELEISECQELTSLPRGIKHLDSIQSLTIVGCSKLTTVSNLSNNELTSLHSFSVNGRHFPREWKLMMTRSSCKFRSMSNA